MNNMDQNHFSHLVSVFQDRKAPEEGYLAGYACLIVAYGLEVPQPDVLSIISQKHRQYKTSDWQVFTPRHKPDDTFIGHLTFALKYEGIELYLLKKLFEKLDNKELTQSITEEPNGLYRRKIWYLYEWLMGIMLNLGDLSTGNYIDLVDIKMQYALTQGTEVVKRQRLRNNLPGTKEFCPMVRKTEKLEQLIRLGLSGQIKHIIGTIHPDVMARTAAFLLLKDSKASYAIEGEKPAQNRAQRWGRALGQAGRIPVTLEELNRLQHIVIDNPRFTKMGLRQEEGFIGEHDRRYGTPIPDHISARWKDIEGLVTGLAKTSSKLENDTEFDAVLAATIIAFGFVFIHPFVDGNGRIHRYLIHHLLLRKDYVPKGMIFPVSSIILERLDEYRQVLEAFSMPRMDMVEWQPDDSNNVEVRNETVDLYRYFDATKQAEFLYDCVRQTIEQTIPDEVDYLEKYDLMKDYLDNYFEMPDKTVALIVRLLEQGKGKLSERAKNKEFNSLTSEEVTRIEERYQEVFVSDKMKG
jgi:hypothetical protein